MDASPGRFLVTAAGSVTLHNVVVDIIYIVFPLPLQFITATATATSKYAQTPFSLFNVNTTIV